MSPPIPSHSGATPAATEMEDAAAGGGDFAVITPAPEPTCPVCMEPWTCTGDHRICCIPCGHVYGRSCLERWLHRCGDDSAKCPQCGELFEDNLIINLYAPGNLWDGCCRLQELKSHYESEIHEVVTHFETRMAENMAHVQEREAYYRRVLIYCQNAQEYIVTCANHEVYLYTLIQAFMEFCANGTPVPPIGPRPPRPQIPLYPKEEFFALHATGTPGSAQSNQFFGGAPGGSGRSTPSSESSVTPVNDGALGPGASTSSRPAPIP